MSSLPERMYTAWRRAQHDPTEHPSWGNLPAEQRGAWEAVAKVPDPLLTAEDTEALRELREELRANAYDWEGGTADIIAALDKVLARRPA